MNKDELAEIMRQLIDLGENQSELSMWHKLYDVLSEDDQKKLAENLKKELESLKALSK